MKKSITLLTLALAVYGTSFANHSTTALTAKAFEKTTSSSDYNDLLGAKYVSVADPNLIATELGGLKKSAKTISEIINDDLKITEGTPAKKVVLTKKKAVKKITFKKAIQN